jgi:hypothetical protein
MKATAITLLSFTVASTGAGTACRTDSQLLRACTHKIANGDSDLIKVRFGALSGLKPDISRGPLRAKTQT